MNEHDFLRALEASDVPPHLHDGLLNYILHGRATGGFLTAVLRNDLLGAVTRADIESTLGLKPLVMWLAEYAPSACWGSSANQEGWLAQNGLLRTP